MAYWCRPLVNTMISTVDEPVFHDAVDTSGKTKDAELVASIIAECGEKVGADNVVLVCTDNARNCVKAGVRPAFFLAMCSLCHHRG